MKSVLIPAGVVLALLVCPAKADDADPTPDVIGCLKAVEPLDMRYRSWMQLQCFGVAADICVALDPGTGACWSDLVGSMRALKWAADAFEDVPECAELGVPTIDLFYRARQAGVALP